MKIIEPSYEIITPKTKEEGLEILKVMERAARTCYQSQDKATEDGSSAEKLVKFLRDKGHHAMLEFGTMTVKFICCRGISHELVRHRLCSFAQESTRYVRLNDIEVIVPPTIVENSEAYESWEIAIKSAEKSYAELLDMGYAPQIARSVLPTCLKTEIVVQGNIREWMHIFQMRTQIAAHPQMRQLMQPLLVEVKQIVPIIFDDIDCGN